MSSCQKAFIEIKGKASLTAPSQACTTVTQKDIATCELNPWVPSTLTWIFISIPLRRWVKILKLRRQQQRVRTFTHKDCKNSEGNSPATSQGQWMLASSAISIFQGRINKSPQPKEIKVWPTKRYKQMQNIFTINLTDSRIRKRTTQ